MISRLVKGAATDVACGTVIAVGAAFGGIEGSAAVGVGLFLVPPSLRWALREDDADEPETPKSTKGRFYTTMLATALGGASTIVRSLYPAARDLAFSAGDAHFVQAAGAGLVIGSVLAGALAGARRKESRQRVLFDKAKAELKRFGGFVNRNKNDMAALGFAIIGIPTAGMTVFSYLAASDASLTAKVINFLSVVRPQRPVSALDVSNLFYQAAMLLEGISFTTLTAALMLERKAIKNEVVGILKGINDFRRKIVAKS